MRKIEHIGIAVKDIKASNSLFQALLGSPPYKNEVVDDQHVVTSFFRTGGSKIELVQDTIENGVISRFINKFGEGIHHIAFDVADIKEEMERLRSMGFQLLHDEPKIGADNKLVCFIHPKSANGILVELCQERNNS